MKSKELENKSASATQDKSVRQQLQEAVVNNRKIDIDDSVKLYIYQSKANFEKQYQSFSTNFPDDIDIVSMNEFSCVDFNNHPNKSIMSSHIRRCLSVLIVNRNLDGSIKIASLGHYSPIACYDRDIFKQNIQKQCQDLIHNGLDINNCEVFLSGVNNTNRNADINLANREYIYISLHKK